MEELQREDYECCVSTPKTRHSDLTCLRNLAITIGSNGTSLGV